MIDICVVFVLYTSNVNYYNVYEQRRNNTLVYSFRGKLPVFLDLATLQNFRSNYFARLKTPMHVITRFGQKAPS
jgi:hypothetical protein